MELSQASMVGIFDGLSSIGLQNQLNMVWFWVRDSEWQRHPRHPQEEFCSTAVRLKHTLFTTVTLRTQNANWLKWITTHAIYSTYKLRNSRVYYITFILSLLRAALAFYTLQICFTQIFLFTLWAAWQRTDETGEETSVELTTIALGVKCTFISNLIKTHSRKKKIQKNNFYCKKSIK